MPRNHLSANHNNIEVPIYAHELTTSAPGLYASYVTAQQHALSGPIDHHKIGNTIHHDLPSDLNHAFSTPITHDGANDQHAYIDSDPHQALSHIDPNLPPESSSVPSQDFTPERPRYTQLPPRAAAIINSLSQPREPEHPPNPPTPPQIPNTAPPGEFDMLPPPASTHPSFTALHAFAQAHAAAHGYALSINTTAKNRARIKLACVCYGAPKNTHKLTPETRVRKNRVSAKTGCRMWIEGKRHEDGLWVLRVGEGAHNHPGREMDGWAAQRKRTWGVKGGRIGNGGVTAKEERERGLEDTNLQDQETNNNMQIDSIEDTTNNNNQDSNPPNPTTTSSSHSLESGGLVWQIVEQEMLRKNSPGQGRDRGVGRTVKVLQDRLPGIRIFKRDVYNIRAQIKRARKLAGQDMAGGGSGGIDPTKDTNESDDDDDEMGNAGDDHSTAGRGFAEIDPLLVAQCNDALRNVSQQQQQEGRSTSELESLRRENQVLRQELEQKGKELEEKDNECQRLRMELEVLKMNAAGHGGLYEELRGVGTG